MRATPDTATTSDPHRGPPRAWRRPTPRKNLVIRLAATRTLARLDYADLVPFETLDDPESGETEDTPPSRVPIFRGNPNLRAQHSMNYDLSFEWYLNPAGLFSVSLFKKDVSSFIYRSQSLETVGTTNYIVLPP